MPDDLHLLDAYWRAANYLSVGQIYLLANPLLREPLRPEQIKPRLLGHWGTTPGLNFVYAHMNRVIRAHDLNAIFVTGPGHGGPGLVANTYLEGTYTEVYPQIGRDHEGIRRLFRQFSFPGGIPSHVAPETPGSINEGGELGYSLVHAYGAVFDNPDLLAVCVVGDGEAETGPLATSWHSNKLLNPRRDGAVLPILHLNGYKIANPTVLARIPHEELTAFFEGYGYAPRFVEGSDPDAMHELMASTLDEIVAEITEIQRAAREDGSSARPRWPMIVLRTPKGWTGPKSVDGLQTEGSFRSHQVPLANVRNDPSHLAQLESWLRSYRPQELFEPSGSLRPDLAALAPQGNRRMGANPHANGGLLLRSLELPDFRSYAVDVATPGAKTSEATRVLGTFLRDVVRLNPDSFRIMGPDETESNRLGSVFEVTDRAWDAQRIDGDVHLSPDGRVMEVLSEHLCQGWLEGYLLTGRHGLFNCYEAFIHIIDSMFNQHAKWLKVTREIDWRRPIASFNYLLSSHVWRQDHNGFSHQDPGFIDHVVNKKAEVVRVYLPPDANSQPKSLAALHAVSAAMPAIPAVACFDTAFHATIPLPARTYALPERWRERWRLRRYGFHGLSHAWVARRVPQLLGEPGSELKIISCHLGAGASLCAIAGGVSIDTTMGFTPLEGLVMATRSGSVDPGMLLWLLELEDITERELAEALEHESGLLGLAGTADMREVIERAQNGQEPATLALEVYLHRLRAAVGAMAASLQGLDVFVFTGGVGERAALVRSRAVAGLRFLGVAIDERTNAEVSADADLSAPDCRVRTVVVRAREDLEIAHQVRALLGPGPARTHNIFGASGLE